MRFVFLHGGPGFNSFPEQAILGPVFQSCGHDIVCWNEPSRLRPDGDPFEASGAFERWLASAEEHVRRAAAAPVHLVTHSCSVLAAIEIARRHPTWVASMAFIAPGADLFSTFANVLRLAHDDLAEVNPEAASAIADCLARTRRVLDTAMRDGLMSALQDDRLLTHYWADPDQFRASMAAMARPDAQFDAESFFAVLPGLGDSSLSLLSRTSISTPTLAVFGAEDPVTPIDEQQSAIAAALPHAAFHVFDGASHCVHLDRPEAFVDLLLEWATASERR